MTGGDETRWLSRQEMAAWRTYIVGSALLEHRLSHELQAEHGISLADYEILVRLSEHPDRQLRMSRLAEDVAHSKSRISHQIRRLEAKGLVQRSECSEDARGVFALLTEEGEHLLERAAPTHVAGVREHMVDLLAPEERGMLADVFRRITGHLRSEED
ncbi:MarR family transcriptional regulator [Halopolyspora algeriensis]|uniref:MarR family transcriptional regulator n=1 Tax=Halopolyspora algeriensis TaxID=1500506 RepID=A0A368VCW4_9ACTN|nr:MarR family transcriptional regulator [Halopolyspora algeriensis]RCW38533.1 MarR family transcriptional regulator [Halopolyspora algeriensis]TQM42614.1 MarR family transcriptional regulator [Halopolyspora algeriensis]